MKNEMKCAVSVKRYREESTIRLTDNGELLIMMSDNPDRITRKKEVARRLAESYGLSLNDHELTITCNIAEADKAFRKMVAAMTEIEYLCV
mgnify:FL=1